MGLKALATYVVQDTPRIARLYWRGIHEAWMAARPSSLSQQSVHEDNAAIGRAAQSIARGHVAMFVLLLAGIVAYLSTGNGDLEALTKSVRTSKLGPKFAQWLERNEGKLMKDERLHLRREKPAKKPSGVARKDAGPKPAQRSRPNKAVPQTSEHPSFRGPVRYRAAADANTELIDRGIADPAHPPFKAGTLVSDRTMSKGERVNMLIDDAQMSDLQLTGNCGLGGWASTDSFTSQSQGLDSMAITSGRGGFKPNGVQFQIELEAQSPIRVLEGTAGPQGALGGGGKQTFLDVPPQMRRSVLKVVGVKPLLGP